MCGLRNPANPSHRPVALAVLGLLLGVTAGACSKKRDSSGGPTCQQVVDTHRAAAAAQLENLRAVVGMAVERKAWTLDDANRLLGTTVPVGDIVLAMGGAVPGGAAPRRGNTRVVLLDTLFNNHVRCTSLGIADLWRRVDGMNLPRVDPPFDPATDMILTTVARHLTEGPSSPDSEAYPELIADFNEFINLKYLVILRTLAFVRPRPLGNNVYEQGGFAGQAMVFDLAARSLVVEVPIVALNAVGTTVSVQWDLSHEVGKDLRRVLEREGPAPVNPPDVGPGN